MGDENKLQLTASWQCPSNIALVKYWGKAEGQYPVNPSLSFTLTGAYTETRVQMVEAEEMGVRFLFEGKETPFGQRVHRYVEQLSQENSWMRRFCFTIESRNSFPHSAGIASSASAFGALALCLADLGQQLDRGDAEGTDFFQKVSAWARQGSGSACRSVYPGFSLWGKTHLFESSSDAYAIPVLEQASPVFQQLHDAILLVDSGPKAVSSSAGHRLMDDHLFRRARIAQAHEHLNELYLAILSGDIQKFIDITEAEALSLHALMMTSRPSYMLLKPGSVAIIESIRQFRKQTNIPLCFTIDAGPNIHLLYFGEHKDQIVSYIENELLQHCENRRWLNDRIGGQALKLDEGKE